jgi:hypothetical protein
MGWSFVNICSSNCSRAIRNVATLLVEIKTAYQNKAAQTDWTAERELRNILLLLQHYSKLYSNVYKLKEVPNTKAQLYKYSRFGVPAEKAEL